ncbi:SCO7613 C-terminal domain-containing membrane protein [Streptomyces sp. NPDC051218]|uniref:SCO7613 C-terminal domain-containing membrane protein n=1 Tax=Streptomyces sp. NPDC051218 TaxID=3365645 RepID=UPI003787A50B
MTNIPPPAEELRVLDLELRRLDTRRTQLLQRRAWLIGALQTPAAPGPARPVRAPEATPPNVQNALLTLGGILLTVAAIAFTLVSWGHLGIGWRGALLAVVTLTALGVPAPLLRRKLRSTAETVAALGLALTVLDAYAVHAVALPRADALGYTAAASAVLAALWTAYGLSFRELRLPLPLAVVTAQLPLLLWAHAADAGTHGTAAALLVTAALDVAVALRVRHPGVRAVAAAGACATGLWGAVAAGYLSWSATDLPDAARAGALLILAAAIALVAAWLITEPRQATGAAFAGGLLLVAATGGVLREALPSAWTVPGYLACAVALSAVVRTALPRPVLRGVLGAALPVYALATLWALPAFVTALLGPTSWVGKAWSGTPADTGDAVALAGLSVQHPAIAALALAVVAGATFAATLLPLPTTALPANTPDPRPTTAPPVAPGTTTAPNSEPTSGPGRRPGTPPGPAPAPEPSTSSLDPADAARSGALALTWAALLILPSALHLPYAVGVSVYVTLTAALLAVASRARSKATAFTSISLSVISSVSAALLALATASATLGTLGALAALFLAATALVASGPAAIAACATVAYAAALVGATGTAWDLRTDHIGLLMLAVPAIGALAAARLGRQPLAAPVEISGAVAGGLAVALTAGHATTLALALALGGLIAAGTALRTDRRPVGYAAGVLFLLASWARLAAWEVETPEAYTLPVTVPALLIGALRRHRVPETSSWTAYGPGLAATLLPSLVAAWSDPHWQRPLLLGIAALLITLAGARHRLQAPLVLGGTALALDALHELAPYIVQVVDTLPRWLPPALAGLLLLAIGATYEQRLRDARRVRDVLGRMH